MGSSGRRAKDTDRDLAVDFVEAAWADGQLTREECDVRVDRLLRATRLSELEQEVRDLQGPDGQAWVPGLPSCRTRSAPSSTWCSAGSRAAR